VVRRVLDFDANGHRLALGIEDVGDDGHDALHRFLAGDARLGDHGFHARAQRRGVLERDVADDEHLVQIGHRGDGVILVGTDLLSRRGVELHHRTGPRREHPVARVALLLHAERADLRARRRRREARFTELALGDHQIVLRSGARLDQDLQARRQRLLGADRELRRPELALHVGEIAAADEHQLVALLHVIADVHLDADDAAVEGREARRGARLDGGDSRRDRVSRDGRAELDARRLERHRHRLGLERDRLLVGRERRGRLGGGRLHQLGNDQHGDDGGDQRAHHGAEGHGGRLAARTALFPDGVRLVTHGGASRGAVPRS
jgi:hypothetical protein